MESESQHEWYAGYRAIIEEAYLPHAEPWRGSGFSGPRERWELLRRPIAEAIDRSGSFLDIGCANGYLLSCLMEWTEERGIAIDPHGLDMSEPLKPAIDARGLDALFRSEHHSAEGNRATAEAVLQELMRHRLLAQTADR